MSHRMVRGTLGIIAVRVWEPPLPRYVAIVAHGVAEHSGRYAHVAAELLLHEAAVYAHDHHGHGLSDGERALVTDVDVLVADLHRVVETAQAAHPTIPIVLIGHAMGGLVATRFAQTHPRALDALVLSSPVIARNQPAPTSEEDDEPHTLTGDVADDDLVYRGPVKRATLEAIREGVDAVWDGPTFGPLPTLWLHGEDDRAASVAEARIAVERLSGGELVERVYAGAEHEPFSAANRGEVLGHVTRFVDETF